jgi:hypothetical protein
LFSFYFGSNEAELAENFDFNSTYEEATQFLYTSSGDLSPIDKYILGHSIVNCAQTVTWDLSLA